MYTGVHATLVNTAAFPDIVHAYGCATWKGCAAASSCPCILTPHLGGLKAAGPMCRPLGLPSCSHTVAGCMYSSTHTLRAAMRGGSTSTGAAGDRVPPRAAGLAARNSCRCLDTKGHALLPMCGPSAAALCKTTSLAWRASAAGRIPCCLCVPLRLLHAGTVRHAPQKSTLRQHRSQEQGTLQLRGVPQHASSHAADGTAC